MKLQKMEGGIHGIDLAVTAHAEKEDSETLIEPDIGGSLDRQKLLGGLEHDWIMTFHSVGNVIIPTDELIFFGGVETTNQLCFSCFGGWERHWIMLLWLYDLIKCHRLIILNVLFGQKYIILNFLFGQTEIDNGT